MIRHLYSWLLRLHPRPFQKRFSVEMLETFDDASNTLGTCRLLADAVVSLSRQWAFRPEGHVPPAIANAAMPASDGPVFHSFDSYMPRPMVLLHGAMLAVVFFWGTAFVVTHWRAPLRVLIGSRQTRSGLLTVRRSSVAPSNDYAEVRVKPPADDPWAEFAKRYFKSILVLGALDANHDLVIDADEIANAPVALRQLDLNHDGRLSPEECGFNGPVEERLRTAFMRFTPVLSALDADHDSEISAVEILNAPAALRKLDLNGDGRLIPIEIAPDSEVRKVLDMLW